MYPKKGISDNLNYREKDFSHTQSRCNLCQKVA